MLILKMGVDDLVKNDLKRDGIALVVVLWVFVILSVVVVSMIKLSMLNGKISLFESEKVKCSWAARAGLESAIAIIEKDETGIDTLDDEWAVNIADFNDVEINGCVFTVKVVDENSKLNLNIATEKQLAELSGMTQTAADSIVDWRDQDSDPLGEGAESGYYNSLSLPYKIRNDLMCTTREVMFVKGVDEEMFYGEDINYNSKLDYNENDFEKRMPIDD